MEAVFEFLAANKVALLAFAFALSEVLALVPGVKSNSVFQLVVALLAKFAPKPKVEEKK